MYYEDDELAYNSADYWCDLCGNGVKSYIILLDNIKYEVCEHCNNLS